jgi:hypothetical protein
MRKKLLKMNKYLKSVFIPLIVFFIVISIPTLLLSDDTWDGILISYAIELNNFLILKKLFFDSTWYLQYYFILVIIELSELIGFTYKNVNTIIIFLIMTIYLREVYIFSKQQVKLNKIAVIISVSFAALFPIWSILLSSVLTFHLFCVTIGLIGIRLVHHQDKLNKLVGILIVTAAYSLQSQLVFLPVLSYFYDLNKNLQFTNKNYKPSTETLIILLISFIFYFVVKILYKPSGLHEGYHNLFILSVNGILPVVLRFGHYVTYLIPIALAILIYELIKISSNKYYYQINQNDNDKNCVIYILLLLIASVFPYAVVGQSSILWDINDWNGRQAILTVFPLAILTSILYQFIYDYTNSIYLKKIITNLILLVIIFNLFLLIIGVLAKHNRQLFFEKIIEIIKINEKKIPKGIVQIISKNTPNTVFELYEPNYLMFKATGKKIWWTRIGNHVDSDFNIPDYVKNRKANQKLLIYDHDETHSVNHTIIYLDTNGYSGITNLFRNFFNSNIDNSIILIKIEKL